MAEGCPRIRLLPDHVWKKVASSRELTSPEHVIEGLLRNALDANASSIVIEVEFSKGYISVCDNGNGIKEVEFSEQGQLARLHCSSKSYYSDPTYGHYGRFLSNLSHLSLLSIASEHQSEDFANRLILHRGDVVSRQLRLGREDLGIVRKGTIVTVHNLFGDVPVRFKHLSQLYSSSAETERGFNQVKEMLVGYLLAQSAAVEVRFRVKGQRQHSFHCRSSILNRGRFSLESTVSTLFQAKLVASLDTTNWHSVSVRTSHFLIRAAISSEPSPNKRTQFISIGKSPIRRGQGIDCLFDAVDRLCEESRFGSLDLARNVSSDTTKDRESGDCTSHPIKLQNAVDKWPTFHIQIEPRSRELSHKLGLEYSLADIFPVTDHLTRAVESLVSNFLFAYECTATPERNGARSGRGQRKREDESCRQLVRESTAKLSKLPATEARYLNHWRRVKSARLPEENFRYGLSLRNPDDLSCLPMRASEGHPPIGIPRLEVPDPRNMARENQVVCDDDDKTVVGLPWINPRNAQVIYLHPRTGAAIPLDSLDHVRSDRSRAHSTPIQQGQGSKNSRDNDGQKPWAKPILNLQQYLQKSSHHQVDAPITCITSEQSPGLSGKCHSAGGHGNAIWDSQFVSKGALSGATIIQQVDRKFILAVLAAQDTRDPYSSESIERRLLVLIDQHAADERIKFERLCDDFCKRTSTNLAKPLVFEFDETEARLLEEHREYFREWSVSYNIVENTQAAQLSTCSRSHGTWTVEVTVLPALIIERCRADPKLLADIMRGEIWLGCGRRRRTPRPYPPQSDEPSWWSDMVDCPKGMIELLKSRSCRSAIMFNDYLDTRQCHELVRNLSQCTLPFQCAHGRPTLTVLADLNGGDFYGLGMGANVDPSNAALGFGDAWRGWSK
ncbi:uncharacterized protein Z520_10921 [Fonsecaea multimorphosa CBS 102226]|uniref:MutL C-terminal dimerisation domain-containing protein n=1 Tax=Fonsecaea multimorphosa CBS 102226 TaxID=1442371 RepID=A0A0D2KA49_9EURO|nr:uncharacterized protein Z520_10921 [Fonsecaea multimorphosa CBS 102226]KIX93278.1 hypothetical protein Z520_10921 [Fonsecaea multimorphosa CBS 102226]OAL18517.1 hypothetical protein AYO22_10494 [Fonsecaea multimorphosa]